MSELPVIDLDASDAAVRLDAACRTAGFFAVPLPEELQELHRSVLALSAEFFGFGAAEKSLVSMERGGRAWRGWFPLGGELTAGVPDRKEGFYFGTELPPDPRPMHGPNLWPERPSQFRSAVTDWMDAMEALGQRVLSLLAVGLGLDSSWFRAHLTASPTSLFRVFRYPPHPTGDVDTWGVGEHSDYGLLTLLATDGTPGLEVKVRGRWIAAPADEQLVICNLGDMLDRLTGGRYRSNPHRVRNHAGHDRYSLPFFLDPSWDAVISPLELDDGWTEPDDAAERWDRANLRNVSGVYGDWLSAKVAKVFPDLAADQQLTP